jgi:hypothetical protein
MASSMPLILRRPQSGRLEGRTTAIQPVPRKAGTHRSDARAVEAGAPAFAGVGFRLLAA